MQFAAESRGWRVARTLCSADQGPPMGTGSSKVKEVSPVTEWSYSATPEIDSNDNHEIGPLIDSISGRPFVERSDSVLSEASLSGQEEEEEEVRHVVQKPPPRFNVPLYIQPSTPQKSVPNDLQELQDLSRTFDSLGIPETRIDSKEERWIGIKDDETIGLVQSSAGDLSRLGDVPNFSAGSRISVGPSLREGATISREGAGLRSGPGFKGGKLESGLSARSHSGPPPQPRRETKKVNLKAVSAPTNFIWSPAEEGPKPAASDEWVYAKKEVDGFDLDKFRSENSGARHGSSHLMPKMFPSALTGSLAASHPHSVPEYDSIEEQIFGNIEQEYSHN